MLNKRAGGVFAGLSFLQYKLFSFLFAFPFFFSFNYSAHALPNNNHYFSATIGNKSPIHLPETINFTDEYAGESAFSFADISQTIFSLNYKYKLAKYYLDISYSSFSNNLLKRDTYRSPDGKYRFGFADEGGVSFNFLGLGFGKALFANPKSNLLWSGSLLFVKSSWHAAIRPYRDPTAEPSLIINDNQYNVGSSLSLCLMLNVLDNLKVCNSLDFYIFKERFFKDNASIFSHNFSSPVILYFYSFSVGLSCAW